MLISPVDNYLIPHVVMGGKGRPFSMSLLDREAPLPLTPFTTTPISGSDVHQLINTPFYFSPQLGLSAMACDQRRPAEEETVNPHPSPLPTKPESLHPKTLSTQGRQLLWGLRGPQL